MRIFATRHHASMAHSPEVQGTQPVPKFSMKFRKIWTSPRNLPARDRPNLGQISTRDRTSTSRFHRFILRQPLLECEHPETSVISEMQSTHAISADEISGMQSTHAFNQCNQFGIDSGHGGSQWSAEYAPSGICPLIIPPTEVVR